MSGNIAINPETGEMLVISPQGQWVPPQRARNPETGAEVFYDGTEWRPVPAARTAPTAAAPAPTAESVGRNWLERNFLDIPERGYQQTGIGVAAMRGRSPNSFYGLSPEDAASEIVQRQERLRQIPQTEEVQRVGRAAEESGSVLGAVGQYARSPEAIVNITGESIGANPVGGVIGAAGAALPTPFLRQIVGALAGALNFPTEFVGSLGQSLLEAARDQGIDPTNRQQLAGLIRAINADPALFEKTRNDALIRAGIISATDAVAGGLAGRMGGRNFAGRVGGGAGVEGAGGGLGEAGAQLATEGQINPAEVGAEIVGSGVGGGLGNLTRAGAPPAGPRTREEDEALRGAIDTVTGERNYLDETRSAFDEAARQAEARDRANRFPDIRNVEPERYALDNFSLASDLLEIRDRKLPALFGEAREARLGLGAVERAAATAGIATQDHPEYGAAKARLDNVEKEIAKQREEIAYLTPRVDPRSTLVGAAEQLSKATENLDYINRTREDARARLAKAKNPKKSKDASKTSPIDLGNIQSIEAEIADLNTKAYAEQRNVARLKQLVPENERQITNLQNRKSFTESASKIAEGKAGRAGPGVTDLRVGAAQPGQNRLVLEPQFDKKNRLIGGEAIIRLGTPNPDGSVVAYVNRQIGGQVQEVAVPTNVDKIYQFPMRERTPGVPSASLTQEAAEAELGPEQIFGNRRGAAVDPNQMDLNPRRVTDRVGGKDTGTASPEPDYVAPRLPAPAPAAAAPAAPSQQGVLPEAGSQQQAPPIIAPGEQVASFNVPEGKEFTVITPDGSMRVNVVPEVVDLFSLIPASGDFQNRDVNAKPNQSTINAIANSPDFFQLTTSPYADRGAPIIGPDDMIEVGNHRVMGLKLATQVNPDGFARYVSDLSNAGYDTKGMQFPVLVRRRVTELTDDQRVDFARLANKDPSQSFSALETAKEDASKITPELMAKFDGEVTGGIRAAKNMPFVRSFLSSLLTRNELNKSITAEGNISDELETRIKNALFAHAYKNPQLLAKVVERGDDDSKTITNGLIGATGAMQELRRGIETDRIRPEFDIVDAIVAASDRLRAAKANGIEMSRVLDTEDMMNPLSDLDKVATLLLLNDNKDKIASASAITKRLKAYAEDAKTQTPDKDLVGGERRITPEEALTKALTPGQTSMFSSRNAPGEQDVEAETESRERKASPEVEQALAVIKARLDSLRAKGKQGAALAKALEDALANRKLNATQIYAAFMIDDALLKTMPKGANYEFQFLDDLVAVDRREADKSGVAKAKRRQGVSLAPAKEGMPGLIQLSLAEDMLPILNETAFHEAFHVLQNYFSAYDKGYKAAIDKHFKNGMKVSDFEPSIKRRLQAMKPPGYDKSYWDLLSEGLGDAKIAQGYEAQAYAFGALADAAMRGEKVAGLLPPFQRFFNFLRDTMAALRSGFTGDGFRTPASLLGGAVDRAARYGQQAPATGGKAYSSRQKITSADTSVNQVAATFKKVDFKPGTKNLDYGGGKYDAGTDYMKSIGVENFVYDPFNRTEEHNKDVISKMAKDKADTVTVNNVLNVIAEGDARDFVVKDAARYLKPNGTAYFLVYEGDRSGEGKRTSKGFQNNKKAEFYLPVVKESFSDVSRQGNMIVAREPKASGEAQFSSRKTPSQPTAPAQSAASAAANAKAFYNTAVSQTNKPNPFEAALAYMFDKKPGETISGAIARTSINLAAPFHNLDAMASKNGYTGLSAGKALEFQMSNSGRINQLLNAGMGKLNAKTGEITLRKDVKPLLEIIKEAEIGNDPVKKGWLQTYLIALRERDLRKVNRQVFTNMSDQQVADTIKDVEARYPKFKQTAADLDKMNKALIEFAVEAGLITKKHGETLSSRFYSPAYREDVNTINNALGVQLTGSDKSLNDLYSNIILNADSIMKASLKNVAMRTAAETMQFAKLGKVNTSDKKNDNTITYRVGGKEINFDVDDPVLYSALTAMPRETIRGIYQAMAGAASFFRDFITAAPSFILSNLYKGKITAYVQEGAPLLTNTLGGVKDALKNTTTLQDFQMQTGFGGMEWGMKPKDMVKTFENKLTDKGMMQAISRGNVFSALRQGFNGLQALSEASEMAERIKLSEGLIKKGMSPRDAYFQAYLLAPYSRKGTGKGWLGQTVQFMSPLIPFLNAKLQTSYRLLENEKGDKRKWWTLGLPQQIFLRGLVVTAFSTAVYALNMADDEDEWDALPNYMKLNYDVIPFTNGLVTLPRAFEIGQVFGALPVFVMDYIRRGEGRDLTDALLQVAVSTVWMNPIPKGIEPLLGAVTNYDFFRRQPLESAGEQGLPIQERVKRSTTSIARGVSSAFNSVFNDSLSPIQAQAILEGYSGTIGTMIMAGFDSVLAAAGAIPGKPAGAFGDPLSMPAIIASSIGADRFYRDRESMTSRFVADFYRVKEMTDQLVRSQTDATNARDYERLQELRGEEGLPLRMRPAVNAASTQISDLNKRIRLIERGQLGAVEKTEAIQPLIARRDNIAKRVVDQARNLGVL